MFHAVTGCDTVSFFCGRGKLTAWQTLKCFPDVSKTFAEMSKGKRPTKISMDAIEQFVVLMYEKNSGMTGVNEARQRLYSQSCRLIENIPPTADALHQHILRAVYQAGVIWGNALHPVLNLPTPRDWGWQEDGNGRWIPKWTTLPQAEDSCYELIRCGCKKGCKTRCKCKSSGYECTGLCYCAGECGMGE